MRVTVDRSAVFKLIDTILPLWQEKEYPYNRKEAVIPQTIVPQELRNDKDALACFYFYACIYMRGGIESKQAFNALLRMRKQHLDFFDPLIVQAMDPREVQEVLKTFIGWDSKAASHNWVENSRRLAAHWGGSPLNLMRGVRSYEDACRRILNKRAKRVLKGFSRQEEGFVGFQHKMVSMLLYFLDWEGLLPRRFAYPSPADFHNFRLGIAAGAILIETAPGKIPRTHEDISAPWRAAVLAYIQKRKADPVEVADAIWLYSLIMCGTSPATTTRKEPLKRHKVGGAQESTLLLVTEEEEGRWDPLERATFSHRALEKTCVICPFADGCRPVPAQPYYTKGQLVIRKPLNIARLKERPGTSIPAAAVEAMQHHFGFPIAKKPAEAS